MTDIPADTSSTVTFEGDPVSFASISGEFETFGDQDWIRISLEEGQTYTFFGSSERPGANAGNSYLQLMNSAGTVIADDYDGGVGYNSVLTFSVATSGVYFVGISETAGSPGQYSLGVTANSLLPLSEGTDADDVATFAGGTVWKLGGKGDDMFTDFSHVLGEQGDDTLTGSTGDDVMSGGLGNDTIFGSSGEDRLFGDAGGDYIDGGDGTDLIFGGDGGDEIHGRSGFNQIHGGSGSDQIVGDIDAESLWGDDGDDYLNGFDGADTILGGTGNDTLDGGTGADTLQGGIGSDTYYVDNAGDHVIDVIGQGTDTVFSSVSFNLSGQELENLTLTGAASIDGTGNSIANTITGNSGSNVINGLGGADTMQGGTGNDTYYVDNAGDHVIDVIGQGTDNVQAYVSFNLSGQELENLQLRSSGSINGTGNSIANIINGNSGNNIIDGLGGADTMSGAQGNDTYYVDNVGDHVIDVIGQGIDNVQAYVSFNLSGQELENLQLRSAASINGTGNSIANVIGGNSGNNIINGLGGNDTLSGSTGQDTFVFTTALNASTNVDTITDFSVVDDTIWVDNAIFAALGGNGTLTANQFVKNTTGLAADGDDHIIYETDTGWLTYDTNGNASGGSTHFATLAANLALTNADFVVV
ncbi:calcium-binding protein [Mesorhizobium calcicola]|uniref:Calcium-binding protein n=1 Tax=Mesorhizobium calcicola TaxID=1300310 RepID=A0ABW4WQW3_9HYPH